MNKTAKNGLLIALSVIIVLVVVVCAGLTCLSWIKGSGEEEEVVEADAEVVDSYTYEDLLAAKEEGRQELLDEIQEMIESGYSTTGALRRVYADTDEILVATDGDIVFVPVSDSVAKSTFSQDNLQVLETGEFQYVENGEVTSNKGIDVSRFQEEIDWEQVAADGVEYAFIRVGIRGYGSGALVEDEAYETNVEGASAQGISVGVYFYSQAITEEEAIEEADFVLEAVSRYDCITLPIVMDVEKVGVEGARADSLTQEERTAICIAFCERIAEAGYTPMIYGNVETFTLLLDIEQVAQYDRWIAYCDEILCFPYEFSIWQYTHDGTVAGIEGSTDLNLSFKEW
ncbi:MAG: glycoside hydrolase family 25 protein [Lachnospiraceae bacterium]|nr:glycoside hydrolase family 25 protein [Lachnospiraceae bacterium]